VKIRYNSNNSGGRWWLKDKDWTALAAAGWVVEDYAHVCREHDEETRKDPAGRPYDPLIWWSQHEDGSMRNLGALATAASKDFETPGDAMREFERLTGQDVADEGCSCCGAPHAFSWGCAGSDACGCPPGKPHRNYGYASGESCLQHLFPRGGPGSLREAWEKHNG
jgi:hypothetical protein